MFSRDEAFCEIFFIMMKKYEYNERERPMSSARMDPLQRGTNLSEGQAQPYPIIEQSIFRPKTDYPIVLQFSLEHLSPLYSIPF